MILDWFLDKHSSSFITYEIQPSIYTFKDLSEALSRFLQSEYEENYNAIDIEVDDITRKTKLVVRSGNIAIRFDEKSFLKNVLGVTPAWDYKHFNEHISQKFLNLNPTKKLHLKYDCINGSILDGCRQPVFYSFVLHKKPGFKVFCAPETILYKKMNKSVWNTITFLLENVTFNGERLTFT